MSRRACLLLGVALLALATWLRPPAPSSGGTPLGALGDSMGGARVGVVDTLFLRAEALRRKGRLEDAASLYRTVLRLDPGNEPAVVFLVNTYVDELLPLGLDPQERFAWWLKARGLLQDALRRHPRSAVLHDRFASLFIDVLRTHDDLVPLLTKAVGDPQLAALRHLRVAFEEVAVLPRQGRAHLTRAAALVQVVAVRALRTRNEGALEEALHIGDLLLERRGEVLGTMTTLAGEGGADDRELLQHALGAIRAVARASSDPASRAMAASKIAAYEALEPDSPLPGALREILHE